MAYEIKLDSFEGPLDLLLYLIRKNNIDIYDIPIAEITAQYLDYMDIMEKFNLEIAGEFLVMSATLIYIKSELLLPKPEIEDEEDPRDELVNKLLQYEKIKEAADLLKEKEKLQRDVFTRNRLIFNDDDYVVDASLFDLLDAFKKIISRVEENVKEIIQEEIKIEDRIKYVLDVIEERGHVDFSALFAKMNMSRQFVIVTFMALLELIKQMKVYARQAKPFDEIRIFKKQPPEPKNNSTQELMEIDENAAEKQVEIINELKEDIKGNITIEEKEKSEEQE